MRKDLILHSNEKSESTMTPRVIVMSDFPPINVIPGSTFEEGEPSDMYSDPDDVQSMVRLLLYSNELEIEGLIASAGTLANVARKKNILDVLDVYEEVHPNLAKRDSRYPTADALRSVTWEGLDGAWGSPYFNTDGTPLDKLIGYELDTEASDAIIKVVDKPDPRPVWICVWGGTCEVAQPNWKVRETRSEKEFKQFLSKLRIFSICRQDNTTDWLTDTFPELLIIVSDKNYRGMFYNSPGSDPSFSNLAWADEHLRKGHGPLGEAYPKSGWNYKTPGVWEGDTPSFLYLVSAIRGVNDPDIPSQCGWGGKFVQTDPDRNHWFDDPMGEESVYKWRADVQAEFKERADWMLP